MPLTVAACAASFDAEPPAEEAGDGETPMDAHRLQLQWQGRPVSVKAAAAQFQSDHIGVGGSSAQWPQRPPLRRARRDNEASFGSHPLHSGIKKGLSDWGTQQLVGKAHGQLVHESLIVGFRMVWSRADDLLLADGGRPHSSSTLAFAHLASGAQSAGSNRGRLNFVLCETLAPAELMKGMLLRIARMHPIVTPRLHFSRNIDAGAVGMFQHVSPEALAVHIVSLLPVGSRLAEVHMLAVPAQPVEGDKFKLVDEGREFYCVERRGLNVPPGAALPRQEQEHGEDNCDDDADWVTTCSAPKRSRQSPSLPDRSRPHHRQPDAQQEPFVIPLQDGLDDLELSIAAIMHDFDAELAREAGGLLEDDVASDGEADGDEDSAPQAAPVEPSEPAARPDLAQPPAVVGDTPRNAIMDCRDVHDANLVCQRYGCALHSGMWCVRRLSDNHEVGRIRLTLEGRTLNGQCKLHTTKGTRCSVLVNLQTPTKSSRGSPNRSSQGSAARTQPSTTH